MKRCYYEVLEISKEASAEEIKRSYRKLARKYHPDVNRHDETAEEMIKEINEAYACLSDPQKRQMYDAYGHAGVNGRGAGSGFGGFQDFGGGMAGFGDIFDMFFGGGMRSETGRQTVGQPGADPRHDVEITLEEAATGVEKSIRTTHQVSCETCGGSGANPGSSAETCKVCRGTGQVRHSQQTILGSFATVSACSSCHGEGKIIREPCPECHGQGRMRKIVERTIKIPAGVENGNRIRLRGEGDAGLRGGPAGDLYIFIHVKPHEIFERHGTEILCEIPVSFVQAALGDTIEVPVLGGKETLRIPEGTQTGAEFKLKGMGMPDINSSVRGDEHVVVRIVTPKKLNDEQKKLLAQFGEATGVHAHSEDGKSFFDRLLRK
jgi:molecular chaperone DnaJ